MELFGWIEDTRSDAESIVNEWGMPAQSERMARRQARLNTRIKHGKRSEAEVLEVMREGSLPGQKIYLVRTRVDR